MPASERAPASRAAACEPTGSLWAPAERRAVLGLDKVIVRAPTTGEVAELRASAEEADATSPFVDDVAEEVLRRPFR